jgi:hypothetical protein
LRLNPITHKRTLLRKTLIGIILLGMVMVAQAQKHGNLAAPLTDTLPRPVADTVRVDTTLRIINLNPYFTLHVDSLLNYDLHINRPNSANYFWYMKSAPVGLQLDRNTGVLYFKADKAFFKSGKLKYDIPYNVQLGVQNLYNPADRADTSLTILFYSTDINPSRLKPTVTETMVVEEGDSIRFKVQCEMGTFPIEQITVNSNMPISQFKPVHQCDDEFAWMVPFDFIKDNDTAKSRTLVLDFIGADKFLNKDTAVVRILVKPGINYPQRNEEHARVSKEISKYIDNLKLTFYAVSKTIKSNKSTRTTFDITSSTTALAGTVLATTATAGTTASDLGKIMPAIGVTLVPVKEAVAPTKLQEQNTATQIRTVTKRLDYMLSENSLSGDRDPEIMAKTKKLREELKQAQLQLVDLPMVELEDEVNRQDAEEYFNSPKVNKKYKLKIN